MQAAVVGVDNDELLCSLCNPPLSSVIPDPERIGYLVMGYRKKLGWLPEARIQQLGEIIASLAQPFETVPHFKELCVGRSA